MDKKVSKIEDPRIESYSRRTRNGVTQVFYTGNDSRDWERYRRDHEECGDSRLITMHDKPDTIYITPPEKHYYAELIEGEWWWMNGCAECNGRPRDWITYIECDTHNVCVTCGVDRASLKDIPAAGKNGWDCQPCRSIKKDRERTRQLQEVAESDYSEWDYHDTSNIICPHCATETEPELGDGMPEGEETCDVCGGVYSVDHDVTVTFSTTVVGNRVVL